MKALVILSILIFTIGCANSCANETETCSGIAAIQCCEGLRCYVRDKSGADRSGTCITGCRRAGEMCGGIAAIQCCQFSRLTCHIPDDQKNVSDAAGTCLAIARRHSLFDRIKHLFRF